MLVTRAQNRHTVSLNPTSRSEITFWFCLSMTGAAVFAILSVRLALSSEYVVQDDARQHVFWMERFLDPELFRGDLIADYFQSVAPIGYKALYQFMAVLGIDPLVVSKWLPALLWLTTTAYCFGTCFQILPIPMAGFFASMLLNQNLAIADNLNSATPRAFLYPLFLAFLYYWLRRSRLPCLIAIALQGLFYPQVMFISVGILVLSLVRWQNGRLYFSTKRQDYVFCGAGLVVAAIALIIYVLHGSNAFGQTIGAAQAKLMPEFWDSGRGGFFSNDPFTFWLFGRRSGILARPEQLLKPPLLLVGLLLPLLLKHRDRARTVSKTSVSKIVPERTVRFPLVQEVTDGVRVLWLTMLSSLGLFFAAHLLLFKLHHPSRYTQHSLRIVLAIAAGITLTILLDALFWVIQKQFYRRLSALALTGMLAIVIAIYPATAPLYKAYPALEWVVPTRMLPGYMTGNQPALYKFFAQQPKDSLIASLAIEADNLPTFAHRSVLVAPEYGIPYHTGYYNQFRQRTIDLIHAQYSPDLTQVRQFTENYGIDFWLLQRRAFEPEYPTSNRWLRQYQPVVTDAIATLNQKPAPVVQQAISKCIVFSEGEFIVLRANCVVRKG